MSKTISTTDVFKQKRDLFYAEALQDKILNEKTFHEIAKFHQSTTWQMPYNWGLDEDTEEWMHLVENTDILPEHAGDEIRFDSESPKDHGYKSVRHFKKNRVIPKGHLGQILQGAFGRSSFRGSKPYPSAGAMYPVIPLLFVLDGSAIGKEGSEGCYVYDGTDYKLSLIQTFEEIDMEKLQRHLCPNEDFYSNVVMGYALDVKRAITKYKKRGYRHGLIEVGLMAQSFRHSLRETQDMGEFCWSGFNDNALTHLAGLNPKLAPILLMQWFGYTR